MPKDKMAGTIDMQLMRYINLFGRITRISTTRCFVYNNQIIFAVPKAQVSTAIGRGAVNVKKLNSILRKKVRIVAMPTTDISSGCEYESHGDFSQSGNLRVSNNGGIGKFVEDVVSPIEFNKIEVKENSVVINAGRQSKAALIGRGRQREKELSEVLKNFFGIVKLRIV